MAAMNAGLQNLKPSFLPPAPWNISRVGFVSRNAIDAFRLADPVPKWGVNEGWPAPSRGDARFDFPPIRPGSLRQRVEKLQRVCEEIQQSGRELIKTLNEYYYFGGAHVQNGEDPERVIKAKRMAEEVVLANAQVVSLMKLHGVPYEPIERYPDLVKFACAFIDAFDKLRAGYGMTLPVDRVRHFIHLVEAQDFDDAVGPTGGGQRVDGKYDRWNGITFVRYETEAGSKAPRLTPDLLDTFAHELIHVGMPGVAPFSKMLNEGIVEKLARDIAFPQISARFYSDMSAMIFRAPQLVENYGEGVLDGGLFTFRDFLLDDSNERVSLRAYSEQVAFVRFVERDSPETYDALVRAALEGNDQGAREAIEGRYGARLADMIATDPDDWSYILTRSYWND